MELDVRKNKNERLGMHKLRRGNGLIGPRMQLNVIFELYSDASLFLVSDAGAALLSLISLCVFASIGLVSLATLLVLEARKTNVWFDLYRIAFSTVQARKFFETVHALQPLSPRQYSAMSGGSMIYLQCKMIFVCRDAPRGRGVSDAGM